MDFDPDQIANAVAGFVAALAVGVPAVWATVQKMRRQVAETKVEVAEATAARGAADADNKVYTRIQSELDRLYDRVTTLDAHIHTLQNDLEKERARSHQLELRLAQLDGFIRSKGLEPPTVTWTAPSVTGTPLKPTGSSVL